MSQSSTPRTRHLLARWRKAGLFACLALLLPVFTEVTPAEALMKAHCKPEVGRGNFDPIVHHNLAPQAHNHTFFANKALLTLGDPNAAAYADLVGAGTTCQNPDDTAGYWIPTLLYRTTGKPVPVNAMIAYYRSFDHKTTGVASPYPPDMRMIAGNAMAKTPQSVKIVNWTCNQNSSRRGPYSSPVEANCATATGTVRLTAHIDFPSCWDGKLNDHTVAGNTADFSGSHAITQHLAYASGSTCPVGFPNKLPELRVTVNWDYTGNGQDITLSSDPVNGPYGLTMHADFWNTWVQTGGRYGGLVGMVKNCINTTSGPAAQCG
jgi:hypothetical protein